MARVTGAPLDYGSVVRVRDTPSQRTLGRTAREANVRGAFIVRAPERLRGERVLVFDDVVTTGATLAAVRGALEAAGASVQCMALARAPLILRGECSRRGSREVWEAFMHPFQRGFPAGRLALIPACTARPQSPSPFANGEGRAVAGMRAIVVLLEACGMNP